MPPPKQKLFEIILTSIRTILNGDRIYQVRIANYSYSSHVTSRHKRIMLMRAADEVKELQGSASFLESVGGIFLTVACCLAIILRQRARRRFQVPPACDSRGTPDGCLAAAEDVCLLCTPCCSACAIAQVPLSPRLAWLPGQARVRSRPCTRPAGGSAHGRRWQRVRSLRRPGAATCPPSTRRLPSSPCFAPSRRRMAGPASAGGGGCLSHRRRIPTRCRPAGAGHGKPHAAVCAFGVRWLSWRFRTSGGTAADGHYGAGLCRSGRRVCAAGVRRAAVGPCDQDGRWVGSQVTGLTTPS
jgi:hypothetical protein